MYVILFCEINKYIIVITVIIPQTIFVPTKYIIVASLLQSNTGSTVSSQSLSPCFSFFQSLYAISPCHILEQDTGVCHLHLTHLLTACLQTLSPAADLAEPRPPHHNMYIYVYMCVCVCVYIYTVGQKSI